MGVSYKRAWIEATIRVDGDASCSNTSFDSWGFSALQAGLFVDRLRFEEAMPCFPAVCACISSGRVFIGRLVRALF